MKSFLAAGAILTLSLYCARVEADSPQRAFAGTQAQNWRPQVPNYGTQGYAAPNTNAAQSYTPSLPFFGQTGPSYQPAVPHVASVPQTSSFSNAYVANAGNAYSGTVNGPVLDPQPDYTVPANGATSGCGPGPVYSYEGPYQQAMAAPSWCGSPAPAAQGCPTWFGGVYGLIMTRDGEEDFYLFTSDADPSRLYCPSSDFETDYTGGTEVRFGRTFCCCKWGLEFVYWGLNPTYAAATIDTVDVPGTMRSTVDYYLVWNDFPPAVEITAVTDNVVFSRIRRREEYHNVEINILSGPLTLAAADCGCGNACGSGYGACGVGRGGVAGPCGTGACGYTPGYYGRGNGNRGCGGPRWVANWAFGVRYFKFDEGLNIFMDRDDRDDYSTDYEIFHDIDMENNLVGVQLGTDINYCLTKCLHLDFGSKFGIYGNHATQYQRIFSPNAPAYVLPGTPQDFTVRSEEDEVAFLGELRVGFGYRIGCHCRFTGGYRAVAASGVATALGQIRHGRTLGRLAKVADIETDDSLVLHGAYVGTEFAW